MWSTEQFYQLSLLTYVAASILFPAAMIFAAKVLGPSNPNPVKNSTFECGQVPIGEAHVQFTVQYLPYAMIYAIFGALAVFLLIVAPSIALFDTEMLEFAVIVVVISSLACIGAAVSLRLRSR
jgi:NADH-quinone oxidoreductase subunit A